MEKLGFVLLLAALGLASAWALARSETTAHGAGEILQPIALVAALLVFAGAVLHFSRFHDLSRVSGRASWAISGGALGGAIACLSALVRKRLFHEVPGNRRGGAFAIAMQSLAVGGLTLSTAVALRIGGLPAVAVAVYGYAFGAAMYSVAIEEAGDTFVVTTVFAAAATGTAMNAATHNDPLLTAVDPTALLALPLLIVVLGAHAIAVGVMAIQSDDGEAPDAPALRGFAVSTATALAGAATACQWWGRAAGHGAWLAMAAIIGSLAGISVLLVGRYYDDPTLRPHQALSRGTLAASAVGMEASAGLAVLLVLITLAAFVFGDLSAIAMGRSLALVVVGAMVIASAGYLAALTAAGGTPLAHHVVAIAIANGLLARSRSIEGPTDYAAGTCLGLFALALFVVLRTWRLPRVAALVPLLFLVQALVRGPQGLSFAIATMTAAGLLVAIIVERATLLSHPAAARNLVAVLPSTIAAAGACAAMSAAILG